MNFLSLFQFFTIIFYSSYFLSTEIGAKPIHGNRSSKKNTDCVKNAKLDLYYLQDYTGSFEDDLPALRKHFPRILRDLEREFPGSRFGAGKFGDNKRPTKFSRYQFCYQHLHNLSSDYRPIIDYIFNDLHPNAGDSEREEDSLSAMTVAALNDTLEWRPYGIDKADGRLVIPVIMVITDALFQYTAPALPGLKFGKKPLLGHPPKANSKVTVAYTCTTDDYATVETARDALSRRKAVPLILSTKATLPGWKLLLKYFNLGGIVTQIDSDSGNIVQAVKKSLDAIVCEAEAVAELPSKITVENEPEISVAQPDTTLPKRVAVKPKQPERETVTQVGSLHPKRDGIKLNEAKPKVETKVIEPKDEDITEVESPFSVLEKVKPNEPEPEPEIDEQLPSGRPIENTPSVILEPELEAVIQFPSVSPNEPEPELEAVIQFPSVSPNDPEPEPELELEVDEEVPSGNPNENTSSVTLEPKPETVQQLTTAEPDAMTPNETVEEIETKPDKQIRPDTGSPDKPDTGSPDKPDTGSPDKPDTGSPDKPDTGSPDKPDTGSPDKPDTGSPDKPDTGTENLPEEETKYSTAPAEHTESTQTDSTEPKTEKASKTIIPVVLGAASGAGVLAAAGGYAAFKFTGAPSVSSSPVSYFDGSDGPTINMEKDILNLAVEGDFA